MFSLEASHHNTTNRGETAGSSRPGFTSSWLMLFVVFLRNRVIQVSAVVPALSCFLSVKSFVKLQRCFNVFAGKLLFFLHWGRKCETLQGVSTASKPRHKLLKCFHHSWDKQDFTAFCCESRRLGLKMAFCREIPVRATTKGTLTPMTVLI